MQYTQEGIIKITTILLNLKQSVIPRIDWAKSNKVVSHFLREPEYSKVCCHTVIMSKRILPNFFLITFF